MAYADPNVPPPPAPPQQRAVSDTTLAMIVYILYLVSYIVSGLTAVAGVIVAYVQIGSADPMLRTHYQFQIRTFWIGLLYVLVGTVLIFAFGIGLLVWLWWFIWTLVRSIKAMVDLNEGR